MFLSLTEIDYSPAKRTLLDHINAIKSSNNVLSTSKASGRLSALNEEEWEVVA